MYRILIVEDDSDINQMICEYLNGEGFCCSQAFSGSEGKLLFSMSEFDLVILDLMLPGIPGEELIEVFADRVPVIVLSAKNGLDSKIELLKAGQMTICASLLNCRSFWYGSRFSSANADGSLRQERMRRFSLIGNGR